MTGAPIDITNKRFGKLTALHIAEKYDKRAWLCQCDCGNEIIAPTFQLNNGSIIQCKDCRSVNLIGTRSGLLVVIKKLNQVNGRQKWLCQCDCGKTKETFTRNIQRQVTTHCGCKTFENMSKAITLPENQAAWNNLFSQYKGNAKRKNLEFTLTKEELFNLCKSKCHYCGMEPQRLLRFNRPEFEESFNGIDRKDNSIGYTFSNSISCCTLCNYMKKTMNYEDFLDHIHKIYFNLLVNS